MLLSLNVTVSCIILTLYGANCRLYFTRVKLGNPAKEFYVQIDTGSDILWVACSPCDGCPTSSGLNVRPLDSITYFKIISVS